MYHPYPNPYPILQNRTGSTVNNVNYTHVNPYQFTQYEQPIMPNYTQQQYAQQDFPPQQQMAFMNSPLPSISDNYYGPTPYMSPYPKPAPFIKPASPVQSLLSQFKKSDGQVDFNKMIDTAGQMMNAVNQMGGLFKGVTSLFK
ncbi:YppG family protein [Metabacillus malikii]|uniref:Spore coat protein n=1 Tax=Metabacillus malikii TaxID=1504265 RepID=A0ABT9ZA33_9BACI|nr:YppG family protein [Metabacillus malikii]MDQ0228799.1 hypothetical protein [Metabacillus malikii]